MADEGDEGGYTGGGYASGGEDADTRSAERKASAVAGAARERLRSRLLPHLPQLSSQKDLTIFLIDCGPSMSQPSPLGAPPGFPAGQTCSCLSLAIWLVEQAFRKKCEHERPASPPTLVSDRLRTPLPPRPGWRWTTRTCWAWCSSPRRVQAAAHPAPRALRRRHLPSQREAHCPVALFGAESYPGVFVLEPSGEEAQRESVDVPTARRVNQLKSLWAPLLSHFADNIGVGEQKGKAAALVRALIVCDDLVKRAIKA